MLKYCIFAKQKLNQFSYWQIKWDYYLGQSDESIVSEMRAASYFQSPAHISVQRILRYHISKRAKSSQCKSSRQNHLFNEVINLRRKQLSPKATSEASVRWTQSARHSVWSWWQCALSDNTVSSVIPCTQPPGHGHLATPFSTWQLTNQSVNDATHQAFVGVNYRQVGTTLGQVSETSISYLHA